MLSELRISNVALIERQELTLYPGFSVLTGETGAGKSIVIDALNFVLGERASRELIMSGKTKAAVEATFILDESDAVYPVLTQHEIELEDNELVLYRELSASGKNTCRVAGVPVSTAILKAVGDALVDIHGQHSHQQLLDAKKHLDVLDHFGGASILSLRQTVQGLYAAYHASEQALKQATMDERERERRCDLLSYQINEIEKAALTIGEDEDLATQRRLLQNAQTIMESLQQAMDGLSGDMGVLTGLTTVLRALERISAYSDEYGDIASRFQDSYYAIDDIAADVIHLHEAFSYEPEELDKIEWRLEEISALKRKYGSSIADILSYLARIREEYTDLSESEARHERLEKAYREQKEAYLKAAVELSELRMAAGKVLKEQIVSELRDLGMPSASFETRIEANPDRGGASGIDTVEFMLSANLGEPVKPLSKIASGGELSRIMLGLKSVLSNTGAMTMVFDEIDSGIGGRIALAVADKMREIARHRQVLSITHLAQIAAHADHHYFVSKSTADGRTLSTTTELDAAERVRELARIMGSDPNDAIALEHAGQLLHEAARRDA